MGVLQQGSKGSAFSCSSPMLASRSLSGSVTPLGGTSTTQTRSSPSVVRCSQEQEGCHVTCKEDPGIRQVLFKQDIRWLLAVTSLFINKLRILSKALKTETHIEEGYMLTG